MIFNPTLHEFEALLTTRLVAKKLTRDTYPFMVAFYAAIETANELFHEMGMSKELNIESRGNRAYVFHIPTNRLIAELGIIADPSADRGWVKRVRVELLGYKGRSLKEPTIGDLAVSAARLGKSVYLSSADRNKFKIHKPKEVHRV